MATWLSVKKRGSGQPHIMWPMEKYISTSRKPTDQISRRLSYGASRGPPAAVPPALGARTVAAPFSDCAVARLPPRRAMMAAWRSPCPPRPWNWSAGSPSMLVTPGTLLTAFSTRARAGRAAHARHIVLLHAFHLFDLSPAGSMPDFCLFHQLLQRGDQLVDHLVVARPGCRVPRTCADGLPAAPC